MKKIFLCLCAICLSLSGCYNKEYKPNQGQDSVPENRSYEDSSCDPQVLEEDNENSPFINNSLDTGAVPYECLDIHGDESSINIITSAASGGDVVAIVKSGDQMVANSYIQAGDDYTFNLPNGRYQVFFYGGKGWNPNKEMQNGRVGGFVSNESYSKDEPVSLDYQDLTYELILQQNGNFNTIQSSEDEMF